MTRSLRSLKAALLVLLGTASFLVPSVVLTTPAQAAPWNCPISGTGISRSTTCYNGYGEYRVVILCVAWHGASSWNAYGPWIHINTLKPSGAECGWTDHVGSAFAQTR